MFGTNALPWRSIPWFTLLLARCWIRPLLRCHVSLGLWLLIISTLASCNLHCNFFVVTSKVEFLELWNSKDYLVFFLFCCFFKCHFNLDHGSKAYYIFVFCCFFLSTLSTFLTLPIFWKHYDFVKLVADVVLHWREPC